MPRSISSIKFLTNGKGSDMNMGLLKKVDSSTILIFIRFEKNVMIEFNKLREKSMNNFSLRHLLKKQEQGIFQWQTQKKLLSR